MVWLSQTVITPMQNLDNAKEIAIPGGVLQHWLGAVLLENTTLERVRDFAMDFPDYKTYFKQFYIDSKLLKREGDDFDALLKLSRRQIRSVTLNINLSAKWVTLSPQLGYASMRSTHIGEVDWKKGKDAALQERLPGAEAGYLWRQNVYWRIVQNGDGVYVEIESITLSRQPGKLDAGRFLNGFVKNYPREFIEGSIEAIQQAFPRLHH